MLPRATDTNHGKSGSELMLPFLEEAEPGVPLDSARRISDAEDRYHLLVHMAQVNRSANVAER